MEDRLSHLKSIALNLVKVLGGEDKSTLLALEQDGLHSLLNLRDAYRKEALSVDACREEAIKSKAALKNTLSQLRDLLYEQNYYENEIAASQNFSSVYSDAQIDVLPEGDISDKNESIQHQQLIDRLIDELSVRKEMAMELENLKTEHNKLTSTLSDQQKQASTLASQLCVLQRTSGPLCAVLAPSLPFKLAPKSADLLPAPLYTLYARVSAAVQILSAPITISIHGTAAQLSSFSATSTDGLATVETNLYEAHPAAVLLEVHSSSQSAAVLASLSFTWLPRLGVVTVGPLSPTPPDLAARVFPEEMRDMQELESMRQLCDGTFVFDMSRPAKPYKWAQQLAGLVTVTSLPQGDVDMEDPTSAAAVRPSLTATAFVQRLLQVCGIP